VTNASVKKRELSYHGVGSPTSQLVVDFELQGVDALAELLSRRFAPVKILPADPASLSAMSGTYGAHAGIDFSRTRYKGDFTLVPQRLYDGVFFTFPVHGHMLVDQGRKQLLGTTTRAIAAEGFACRSMTFSGNFAERAVVISRPLLAERLSTLLGRPIVEKPLLEPVVNAGTPGLQALRALVEFATGAEFGPALNTGTFTARRYQRQVRLESARKDLVGDSAVPIEDIALKWGFTNAGRFSRYFREAYGVSPFAVARKGPQR
jgi:AraC-like DNA-binding protein